MTYEDQLVALGAQFQTAYSEAEAATTRLEELKVLIREVAKAGESALFKPEDKTVKIGGLSITRSDPNPMPPLRPEELRSRIPDDVFHRVAKIKTVELDVRAWRREVEAETVTDQQLRDSLGDPPAPKAWSVGLA